MFVAEELLLELHVQRGQPFFNGVIDYTVTMATGALITENDFPDFLLSAENQPGKSTLNHPQEFECNPSQGLLATMVQRTEREVIKEVLQKAKNKTEAIKILGISRRTFYTKIKQYNLD